MQLKYIQNCGQDSKAKSTQQLPLKRLLKHFKNLVRSTFLIVCLKDGKLSWCVTSPSCSAFVSCSAVIIIFVGRSKTIFIIIIIIIIIITCSDSFLLHAIHRTVALVFNILSAWQWNFHCHADRILNYETHILRQQFRQGATVRSLPE